MKWEIFCENDFSLMISYMVKGALMSDKYRKIEKKKVLKIKSFFFFNE